MTLTGSSRPGSQITRGVPEMNRKEGETVRSQMTPPLGSIQAAAQSVLRRVRSGFSRKVRELNVYVNHCNF